MVETHFSWFLRWLLFLLCYKRMKLAKPFTPQVTAYLRGTTEKFFHQSICRTKEQNTRLLCLASAMPKSVMQSAAANGKVSKEKKHKNLAVLAKTPRLKRFFPAKLLSSSVKTVALTRAPETIGENQAHNYGAARGRNPPKYFAPAAKMCCTQLKSIGHSLWNLSPSQKTLRPPGVPNWLRTWWKSRHNFRSTFHTQTGWPYWHVLFPVFLFVIFGFCLLFGCMLFFAESLSSPGAPKLSLTKYPFSISTDKCVPLKFIMTDHRYV